jgi:hypothetical protein
MRTKRYQLLQGVVDKVPYIPPIPSEFDYYPDVKRNETLITDDPYHCTMGWLSELGKPSLIKMTNAQVETLFSIMFEQINDKWKRYVDNDRIGYKFGLVAAVEFPAVLRNYDYKWLPYPQLKSVENGIATIVFESFYRYAGIQKYSRTKKDIFSVRTIKIASNGNLISIDHMYAYHDANGNYVKLDYKPAYY